ncbi:MAG: hypothetical protein HYS55_01325 [Candidatus Omnitrophica bacterium]|nr:hypothetical protein [Candidatus Omnitrophota bacterium]
MIPESQSFADKICLKTVIQPELFDCRIAQSFEELREAYQLVYQEYLSRGYCNEKFSKIHYTYFCLLPESRTFLFLDRNMSQVFGTASVILDSSCGLPMETLFRDEINAIRSEGRHLAEISLLASSRKGISGKRSAGKHTTKIGTIFNLFRFLFNYARFAGVTDLVITIHPKHELLYRSLTFQPIGTVKAYSIVRSHPAIPMHLDIPHFCDPRFKNQAVQTFFLKESNPNLFRTKPAHWDMQILKRLFEEAKPLPDEDLFILQSYLQSSHDIFSDQGGADELKPKSTF